jgi:hypothetical protein
MNPWHLSASDLLIWGVVLHLIADWPLQNDWIANNKAKRWSAGLFWWLRHPAAYVHAGIHGALLALVFGWVAAPLALTHLVIDTRWPVAKWSQLVKQTQPKAPVWAERLGVDGRYRLQSGGGRGGPLVDVGMEVRFWTDQVFHIACIAAAALIVNA